MDASLASSKTLPLINWRRKFKPKSWLCQRLNLLTLSAPAMVVKLLNWIASHYYGNIPYSTPDTLCKISST